MGTVTVHLFGAPEVLVDDRRAALDTRKALAVLAVLAVEDRPVRRDRLAGMLWPDADQDRARATLRRTLSTLRGAIGAPAVVADRETVGLDGAALTIDVLRFERLSQTDPAEAVSLYRGEFLEGFSIPDSAEFEQWQRAQTDHFRLRVDELLDELAEEAEPGEAADLARRRLEVDPLNENAARQVMEALGRLDDRAGSVAVYRELVRRLDDDLGVEPLAATTEVYEAVRRGRAPAPVVERIGPASAPTIPLIGRDRDRELVLEAVRRPQLVVITGEPGIGRTRLAEAVHDSLDRSWLLRGHVGEQGIPYSLFSRWMTNVAPGTSVQTFERLATELAPGPGGALVIDDLDLVDPESIAFLIYVIHRRERFGWSIVATWRADRIRPSTRCWELLAEGRRDGWASEVVLERLGAGEVGQLVRAVAGRVSDRDVDRVVEQADGLPLLAVEFARQGPEPDELPPAVGDLMRTRLAGLSPLARQVVEALAVLDRSAGPHLIRAVAGRHDREMGTALAELVDAGVARGDPDLELTHRLLGEVALAELTSPRRRALHERAGEVLPAAEAAEHMTAARRPDEAAALHREAALDARRRHAVTSALEHLRAAVSLSDDHDNDAHLAIGDLESVRGRYAEARRAYEITAARSVGADLAAVELRLARLALRGGDPELAASHLASAEAEVDPGGRAGRLGSELAIAGTVVRSMLGELEEGAVTAMLELAATVDDPAVEAEAESTAALISHQRDDHQQSAVHALRAIRLAEIADTPLLAAAGANLLGLARLAQGDHSGAVSALEQARAVLDQHGDVHRLAAVLANLADSLHADGRDVESRELQLESARLFTEVSGSPVDGRAEIWFLTAW